MSAQDEECLPYSRPNQIMPENNKASAAVATSWGKRNTSLHLSSSCFHWIEEEGQKHKKAMKHWGNEKKRQKPCQSIDCSFTVTSGFPSSWRKTQDNYCESSKLLFLEQQSRGVAPWWGAWRVLLQAELETQHTTGLLFSSLAYIFHFLINLEAFQVNLSA